MYSKELEMVAKRYKLSEKQALELIIHEIFIREYDEEQFRFVLGLGDTYEELQPYSCFGDEDIEDDEHSELNEINIQLEQVKYLVYQIVDKIKHPDDRPPF